MKAKWSRNWIRSKQPRKQRKYRRYAPLHIRQKMISTVLDKKLREQYKRRAVGLRKGDEVLIMRGMFKGKTGKISRIALKELNVFVEGMKMKKVSGQEIEASIDPSNMKIIKLNLDDRKRLDKLSIKTRGLTNVKKK